MLLFRNRVKCGSEISLISKLSRVSSDIVELGVDEASKCNVIVSYFPDLPNVCLNRYNYYLH